LSTDREIEEKRLNELKDLRVVLRSRRNLEGANLWINQALDLLIAQALEYRDDLDETDDDVAGHCDQFLELESRIDDLEAAAEADDE
jgi:hypothetical protein